VNFLLDVNILMALLWENHEHHYTARKWLEKCSAFSTCPLAQLGFARVSSNPQLGYSLSPDQAFTILRRFLADKRHRFVPDDLGCEDRILRTDLIASTKQVTDHYLIALARQHKLSLITFDDVLAKTFSQEAGLVTLLLGDK
jgi:hypothetical protein